MTGADADADGATCGNGANEGTTTTSPNPAALKGDAPVVKPFPPPEVHARSVSWQYMRYMHVAKFKAPIRDSQELPRGVQMYTTLGDIEPVELAGRFVG